MTTNNRWFFSSKRTDETFIYEGDPKNIPGFKGWVSTKQKAGSKKVATSNGRFLYKEPSVLYQGILYYGRSLTATKGEGAPCSKNCRQAMLPFCKCSCQGKNHGIENRDMADAIQEEDVTYLGDY